MGITSVIQDFKLPRFTWFWLPTIAYCAIIFGLSSIPKGIPIPSPYGFDKALHVIEYGILGVLLARSLANSGWRISNASLIMWVVVLTALYGLSDEVHQILVPGRNASPWDVAADFLGGVLAVFLYVKVCSRKQNHVTRKEEFRGKEEGVFPGTETLEDY